MTYTPEHLIILHRELKPDENPYEHDLKARWMGDPPSKGQIYDCGKCFHVFDSTEEEPCPTPDPWPENEATTAELIRVWMDENRDMRYKYFEFIHYNWLAVAVKDFSDEAFSEWLLHQLTPADKINAFFAIHTKEVAE